MIRLQEKIDFKTMLALAVTESEKNTHQKNTMNQKNKEKKNKIFNQLFNTTYIKVTKTIK